MKKRNTLSIVGWSIGAILLCALLVLGLSTDGFGLFGKNFSSSANEPANEKYMYDYEFEAAKVTNLNIDWVSGKVEFKLIDGDTIKVTEFTSKTLKDKEKMKAYLGGNTLEIDWMKNSSSFPKIFTFGFGSTGSKNLLIELPKSILEKLDSIYCNTMSAEMIIPEMKGNVIDLVAISGDIEGENIVADDLSINTTSGNIDLNAVEAKKFEIGTVSGAVKAGTVNAEEFHSSTTSGDIKVTGSLQNVESSTISGTMQIKNEVCPKFVDISSVSGDIQLTLPSNSGFTAEYSSVSGEFMSDFPVTKHEGRSGNVIVGDGASEFSFSTTSGDMKLIKANGLKNKTGE